MHTAYLLLGSNQGNREYYLTEATKQLENRVGAVTRKSMIYETAAWGLEDQPAFLNQVLQVATTLPPDILLTQINLIEKEMGRVREVKWGARVIDIDILYYDVLVLSLPHLVIPHPHLHARRFTLMPLAEIAPDYQHPLLRKTNKTLLAECPDALTATVYKIETPL